MAKALTYFFAAVWLANGLLCKVGDLVPRHREIVARILGDEYSAVLTRSIGFAEIAMAFWIVTRIARRLNAVTQMLLIITMNVLEFFLASDLLLWGRLNALFAGMFVLLIYYKEFKLENAQSDS